MTKSILAFAIGMFFLTGCATLSYHKAENTTPEGDVKIEFGSQQGVHVGDKVNVYENKCNGATRGASRCRISLVGTLTLSKVEEVVSFAKPDNGFQIKEGYVFKLEKHCEANPKECGQN